MFVEHKEQGEAQPAKVGTLKLSEAMRIGAGIRPQGFGGVLAQLSRGTSCALHAAYEAIEGHPHPKISGASEMLEKWACGFACGVIVEEVMDKNDSEKLTREQIADWLESQGY